MRHFGAWRAIALLGLASGMAAVPLIPQAASTGLIVHYKLDEPDSATTAPDSALNHTGTYAGNSTSSTDVPAAMVAFPDPASRNFDGAGDTLTANDQADLRLTGNMTIAFWMKKASEAGDWQRLVGKGNSSLRNYGVWEEAGAGTRILFQQYNSSGAGVLNLFSSGTVAVGAWTHVACKVDNNVGSIFLNNMLSGSATRTGTPGTSSDPLRIAYAGFHTYYPGLLDDIRIYNRALTDAEIGILHAGLPGPSGLTVTAGPLGDLVLDWTASPSAATSYTIYKGDAANNLSVYQAGVTGTTFQDIWVVNPNTYFYAVTAMLSVGESAQSGTVSGTPISIAPRFEDNEEGIVDRSCGCGSTFPSGSAALLAATAALAFLILVRRR